MKKENRQLSTVLKPANFFLNCKKKFAAILIIAIMFINGFVPNAVNISKNSLVMVAGATAYGMVVTMFKQCNDSVAVMSHKITEALVNFLRSTDTSNKLTGTKAENSKKVPDAAGGQTEENNFNAVFENGSKEQFDIYFSPSDKFVYNFAPKIMQGESATGRTIPILLAFMVFIIGFISRKGIENNTIINKILLAISKALCAKHKALLIARRNYEK